MNDRETQPQQATSAPATAAGFLGFGVGAVNVEASRRMSRRSASAVDETSESKAEVKAKLSGEVRVNFKSDYLPLEKMATPEMIGAIQGNAAPTPPPRMAAAAPAQRRRRRARGRRRRERDRPLRRRGRARRSALNGRCGRENLLLAAEAHAVMMAELGEIELPPAGGGRSPCSCARVASLYLASTLEAAGLIAGGRGFRGAGAHRRDPRRSRRGRRRWSTPSGARATSAVSEPSGWRCSAGCSAHRRGQTTRGRRQREFEELLLDLCDAIMKAVDGGSQRPCARQRPAARRERRVGAANDMVPDGGARHLRQRRPGDRDPQPRRSARDAGARARLWDAVASIDRRFRRPARPTLSHLRRGRAGMAVLAWLADAIDTLEQSRAPLVVARRHRWSTPAIEWVDETLSLVRRGDRRTAAAATRRALAAAPAPPAAGRSGATWDAEP